MELLLCSAFLLRSPTVEGFTVDTDALQQWIQRAVPVARQRVAVAYLLLFDQLIQKFRRTRVNGIGEGRLLQRFGQRGSEEKDDQ